MEGLQLSVELPIEEQEEQEDERSRVLTMLGVEAGLASSMPREAMSSMNEGRAAIDTAISDGVQRREDSLRWAIK